MSSSSDSTESPFFEVANLGFRYGRGAEVLRDVSLTVRRGEIAGLIGPNGAGKSTLLHLMTGLLRPTRGSVRLLGGEVGALDPLLRARRLSFVPQAQRIFFPYTVGEIVAMGRHPHHGPFTGLSAEGAERIEWALEATGTAPFVDRMFNQLSGGEAQRVIIARALTQDTLGLVLDEPTASLDLYYQAAVYGLLERLNREHGLTVIVVTHDINLAAEYCPRLIGLREGQIQMDGPPAEILTTENIHRLYGVEAEILSSGGSRMARVRHGSGEAIPPPPTSPN